ncbi:sterol carrier protein domain-containing protein, partial [Nocardioides salarius]|uniref:sterol carrier protein domain-containing protein n=1 Tax=Nocardioides salarius TaxID=374513 RepID=UPI0030F8AC62
ARVDARVVTTTALHDTLWVRVLDLPVALEARPWHADGDVVLDVDDALGHTSGRWRVTTRGGAATVRRTDDEVGVRLSAETLGQLYLGDVDAADLAVAGRVTGPDTDAFAAMADGGPTPWCTTGF